MRRWLPLLSLLLGLLLCMQLGAARAGCDSAPWPLWQAFAARHLQADGRVLDPQSPERHSTSEGQAYGMFFALVGNDRPAFERMLVWTEKQLAGSQLGPALPAWRWTPAGGVRDPHSAADADLWLAYDLIEAGRLWHAPALGARGLALLGGIRAHEVVDAAGLGPVLLPGPEGFVGAAGQLRLNPSYSPLPLLRRLAAADAAGPWLALAESGTRAIEASAPRGMAADWIGWQPGVGFVADATSKAVGSYDAIRVYLWLGMSRPDDPLARRQAARLGGMAAWLDAHATPPERVDTIAGVGVGQAPPGFGAALLPYLKTRGDAARHAALRETARRQLDAFIQGGAPELSYYDLVLSLFGFGWSDGRFRFSPAGALHTYWEPTCPSVTKRSR